MVLGIFENFGISQDPQDLGTWLQDPQDLGSGARVRAGILGSGDSCARVCAREFCARAGLRAGILRARAEIRVLGPLPGPYRPLFKCGCAFLPGKSLEGHIGDSGP